MLFFGLASKSYPMKLLFTLLQAGIHLKEYKGGILCLVTAFVAAMLVMPPLIKLINKFRLYDVPNLRKEHRLPVPTMGGIAVCAGMAVACGLWFPFSKDPFVISLFFGVSVLFGIGIMDDLRNLSAHYRLVIQLAVAFLIAFSDVRITSFHGLFGLYEIPLVAQYTLTMLAIAGITNAFNLIDGIDGLAGGLGFMSLITLGLFLTLSGDGNTALVAFALAGGLLGFLYYNFNPARIFMGDTGSLVLGFTVAVLCIRLIQVNADPNTHLLPHAPVFAFSIVLIPVFDLLRVFSLRLWQGKSPFHADKTHIHHLLTNNGWSHGFAAKLICVVDGLVLILAYFLKDTKQEITFVILFLFMLLTVYFFKRLRHLSGFVQLQTNQLLSK